MPASTLKPATPIALHTTPSGKVTRWGVPGSDATFTTKKAAQAAIDAVPKGKAPGKTEEERRARRRERRAARLAKLTPEQVEARKAKRAEARKARRAARKAEAEAAS